MEASQNTAEQTLYRVKILHSSATDLYSYDGEGELKRNDFVVVPTRYGQELGRIQGTVKSRSEEGWESQCITRQASEDDQERYQLHKRKEENAFQICRKKVEEHGLAMKLVSAHYCIDDKKILFYFTAENRIDFRQLVKDLVAYFKTRIELRQIGVRDEARVLGGMGVCGRTFCCHGITDKLRAVSIKMAKEQNLTLNSMKISGPCGRLLCCLAYEYECYLENRKNLPPEEKRSKENGES
jgi:cell fate regulator YaaT (PSP1 superfamily)